MCVKEGVSADTLESKKRPPPTMIAEMAVPTTAKIMIDPMFLKKFPYTDINKVQNKHTCIYTYTYMYIIYVIVYMYLM